MKIKTRIIEVAPENIFESEVVAIGNGGFVKFFKKYVGKKVWVVLKE